MTETGTDITGADGYVAGTTVPPPSPDSFLTGTPAAKFEAVGDSCVGTVTAKEVVQQREFGTNKPKYWDSGDPMWQLKITVQEDSGTEKVLYLNGSKTDPSTRQGAAIAAIRAAGANDIAIGARFGLTFSGTTPSKVPGNPRKTWTATYEAAKPASNGNTPDPF